MSGRKDTRALLATKALATAMACTGSEGAPMADLENAAIANTVLRLENEMNAAVDAHRLRCRHDPHR